MNNKQEKVFNLFKEFIYIMESNNLQYSLIYGTLLGCIREKGFIPWDDDIDIAIPIETYEWLIKNYPNKIKTNYNSANFLLYPKFTNNNESDMKAVFIDLFITLKTSEINIKKYLSLKNKLRYLHSFSHRSLHNEQLKLKIANKLLFWTWGFKKYKLLDAISDLKNDNGDKNIIINWPFKKITINNTFKDLNFNNFEYKEFENISCKVFKNYNDILEQNYGKNWMVPIKYKMSEHLGMYDMNLNKK